MPDLELTALPAELQAALQRVWPDCAEAQRRAVLGPWAEGVWRTVWPNFLWPWQPAKRWWRPHAARRWRESFEQYFASQQRDVLEAKGPHLFDPAQAFFETPWTNAEAVLRSPVPEVFTDAEFWAIAQQIFAGDVEYAVSQTQNWARELVANRATQRGTRREQWWIDEMVRMHAAATGTYL